jgi:hypothetical protein
MMDKTPDLIHQLESLRRQLEDVDHAMGSAYDYLDRGMPDDTQRRETWKKIEGWREDEVQLKEHLIQLVAEVRKIEPDVITAWADLHKTFYSEVQTRYEDMDEITVPSSEIANIFINSALEKWEQVRAGNKDYVLSIRSFTSQHEDIYAKIFNDQ